MAKLNSAIKFASIMTPAVVMLAERIKNSKLINEAILGKVFEPVKIKLDEIKLFEIAPAEVRPFGTAPRETRPLEIIPASLVRAKKLEILNKPIILAAFGFLTLLCSHSLYGATVGPNKNKACIPALLKAFQTVIHKADSPRSGDPDSSNQQPTSQQLNPSQNDNVRAYVEELKFGDSRENPPEIPGVQAEGTQQDTLDYQAQNLLLYLSPSITFESGARAAAGKSGGRQSIRVEIEPMIGNGHKLNNIVRIFSDVKVKGAAARVIGAEEKRARENAAGEIRSRENGPSQEFSKSVEFRFSASPLGQVLYFHKGKLYLVTSAESPLSIDGQIGEARPQVLVVKNSGFFAKFQGRASEPPDERTFVQIWDLSPLVFQNLGARKAEVTEQLYRYEIWGQFDNMIGRFTTSKGAGYLVGFDQLGERVIFLKITNESDNKSWQVFRVNATGSTKFHLKDGTPMVILRHNIPTGYVGSAEGNLGTVGLTPGMLAPGPTTSSILVEGEYAPVFNRFKSLVTENALIIPEFVFEGPKSHRSRPRPKF